MRMLDKMKSSVYDTQTLYAVTEISFGEYGGAECFFHDIDGDGQLEIITYQGPGVFGSAIYSELNHIKPYMPRSISISVFRIDGTHLWTWGEPNPVNRPFISHAYECCLDCADIDNDGIIEVLLADGNRLVVLDGKTGQEKKIVGLPDDNFYILKALGESTHNNEAAVVVKNGEEGYGSWRYGEPVIGLNSNLEIVWGPKVVLGGGHYILTLDIDGDGRNEYMIGYCVVAPDGKILWTVDTVDPCKFDPDTMHVDFTDVVEDANGNKLFAIAGSDRVYLVSNEGKTIFQDVVIHAQGAVINRFQSQSSLQIACYNAPDGPLNLYDASGHKIWSKSISRKWPFGEPECCKGRPFHRNRPIVTLAGSKNWIGYADGGWPWAVSGHGKFDLKFAPPENSRSFGTELNHKDRCRADDIGYGFALQCLDVDNDGRKEAIIYNRRFLWVYELV